jgi:hypothetical protein
MATTKEMYELIGRAVLDPTFRRRLAADPNTAAQLAGFRLTPTQLHVLSNLDIRLIGQQLDVVLRNQLGQGAGYA